MLLERVTEHRQQCRLIGREREHLDRSHPRFFP